MPERPLKSVNKRLYCDDCAAFSLVEIMISLAITSIIFLALASLFNTSILIRRNLDMSISRDNLRSVLLSTFSHSNSCAPALTTAGNVTKFNLAQAQSATGLPLNITLDSGNTVIVSGDPATGVTPQVLLPNYNISYEYVTFSNAVTQGPDQNIIGNTIYVGAVVMKTDKFTDVVTIGGTEYAPQSVGVLIMSVSPANTIDACVTAVSVSDACASIGGQNGNPTAQAQCIIQSPCALGLLFAGNSASGLPICIAPQSSCPVAGEGLAPNTAGVLTCTPI
jgi:type II secretory pathway pseudopilin PulG